MTLVSQSNDPKCRGSNTPLSVAQTNLQVGRGLRRVDLKFDVHRLRFARGLLRWRRSERGGGRRGHLGRGCAEAVALSTERTGRRRLVVLVCAARDMQLDGLAGAYAKE